MSKLRNSLAQSSHIMQTLHLIWATAPIWTVAWSFLLLLQGLLPGANVYLSKLLVDSLVVAMRAGTSEESFKIVLLPAGLMATVLLLTQLSNAALIFIRKVQSELVLDSITALVHEKSIAADLSFYELPEYHDRLHQARSNASSHSLGLLESTGSLLQNSITLLTMVAILLPYGVWLPLVLLASSIPALYMVVRFNKYYHRWWEKTTPQRRRAEYYDFLLTQVYTAAELRLFELGNYFQLSYQAIRDRLRTETIKLTGEQSYTQLAGGISALLIAGGAMVWMLWRALQGFLTLGDLALFYQAFNSGQSLMRSVLANIGQIYSNSLFLGNLFEFLQLKPQIQDPPQPLPISLPLKQGICLRQVTFRYPGSDRAILQDFNLTIPAGKIVAIVGENGTGKSTLIKLLCRFYDPESGSIELDGIDIKKFSLSEFRRLLTVMFQFPATYQKTVAENIAISDVYSKPSFEEIQAAIQDAGAEEIVARLPQGYDTQLGKMFSGGTDLSGGEWQRIALARAFLRQAPILILDEPTSFMDSWAEHDWLDRFRRMAKNRSAVVITHRFTLAMRADVIHVMQAGQIVESGSHHELLALGGLYAQSWQAQTQANVSLTINGSNPLLSLSEYSD
ncbi:MULTISPECIES: ABC transporter ATP-binding protein [unclassified Anabaena]|uniref:ABC transporter ATP-binding protein n=1 Tax=unclassified Anabaena TaxID=2619674 RepID=UPI0039C5C565